MKNTTKKGGQKNGKMRGDNDHNWSYEEEKENEDHD